MSSSDGKKAEQANQPPILSNELRNHYEKHGVVGIERFITDINSTLKPPRLCKIGDTASSSEEDYCSGSACSESKVCKHVSSSSRFIRLNPRFDVKETLELLISELPNDVKPVQIPWISKKLQFYAIPNTFSLVSSTTFQSGRIYGMDISSGAAVAALLLDEHDRQDVPLNNCNHVGYNQNEKDKNEENNQNGNDKSSFRVLDLCCAPGLKTCAIADLLSLHHDSLQHNIRIIGVDVSEQRIQLCKNIITKYHIDKSTAGKIYNKDIDIAQSSKIMNQSEEGKTPKEHRNQHQIYNLQPRISLYCTDGTTFGKRPIDSSTLIFDSIAAREEEEQKGKRKRMNKSARARRRKRLRSLALEEHAFGRVKDDSSESNHNDLIKIQLFDRVLVDAECSTDGAVRHLQQRYKKSEGDSNMTIGPQNVSNEFAQNHKLTDAKKLADLVDLQKRLLESGFQLLKPGGVLVYSTCSLAIEQNENVVAWLLQTYKHDAFIIPVTFSVEQVENDGYSMIYEGSLKGTVRFHPNVAITNEDTSEVSNQGNNHHLFGGGFFLVKLGKKNDHSVNSQARSY